jgi:hypothetical protein
LLQNGLYDLGWGGLLPDLKIQGWAVAERSRKSYGRPSGTRSVTAK